jgi:hypothetical protein
MSTSRLQARPAPAPKTYHTVAGVLSYLVPGLGQIYQGRVGKGVLFLVCIYTLFFYGLYLGSGTVMAGERPVHVSTAVYLAVTTDAPRDSEGQSTDQSPLNGLSRLATNLYNRPQFICQFWAGVVAWPAIIQYLSYNKAADGETPDDRGHPVLGHFEREPSTAVLSAYHNASDKRIELAWVFTVIAGVLNIMVIYDALAGPAYILSPAEPQKGDA